MTAKRVTSSYAGSVLQRQRGMGFLPAIIVLAVVILLGTCVARLAPLYIEAWSVRNVLDDITQEPGFNQLSASEIRGKISRRFITNRIEAISVKEIGISNNRQGLVIDATYEKRVALLFNIDAVAVFDDLIYEIPRT